MTGFVKNEGAEVIIEIQGSKEAIELFCTELIKEKPFAAVITERVVSDIVVQSNECDFIIQTSNKTESPFNYISPDLGICDTCRKELSSPENRRYQYPFINCTDCGPRFTIIRELPYDRDQTTMSFFPLCRTCKEEYEETSGRRFHAEATGCEECGPELWMCDGEGYRMPFSISDAREKLMEGKIIALKGIGGFHLLCDAYNQNAVALLRKRKHRDKKPFALMAKNLDVVRQYCKLSNYEAQILESAIKPILLLDKKEDRFQYISETNTLGMMLPYTPLHLLLFGTQLELLIATSGNLANEPICYDNQEALHKLRGIADYFILHNREILRPMDDSIIRVQEEECFVIRRARGFVPKTIDFSFIHSQGNARSILSVGAEQKDTFSMTKGSLCMMSQHIGDLTTYETMQTFHKLEQQFEVLFDIRPEIVAGDCHPEYISSYMMRKKQLPVKTIQHHHAHIAACMVENKIKSKVIGIAFDGTGYGEDGQIWGGEFFVCDLRGYERFAHFEYIPMPGGEQCMKEPWRMAAAYLYQYGLFHPSTILQLCEKSEYEAQAAILLEQCCLEQYCLEKCGLERCFKERNVTIEKKKSYQYRLVEGDEIIISCEPLIREILEDIKNQEKKVAISIRFHRTIVRIMVDICIRIRAKLGMKEVAFGGGVFQNMVLGQMAEVELKKAGFHVYRNHEIPVNDGGISVGQAAILYQEEQDVSFSRR